MCVKEREKQLGKAKPVLFFVLFSSTAPGLGFRSMAGRFFSTFWPNWNGVVVVVKGG